MYYRKESMEPLRSVRGYPNIRGTHFDSQCSNPRVSNTQAARLSFVKRGHMLKLYVL